MPAEQELEVSYSVKELIKGLSDRIDGYMQMMASKADQTAVTQVQIRVDGHETRLTKVEHEVETAKRTTKDKSEFRRWVVPVVLSIATVSVLVWQVLHP